MSKCTCGRNTDNEKELCDICNMGKLYDSYYDIRQQYKDYGSYGKDQFELDYEKF